MIRKISVVLLVSVLLGVGSVWAAATKDLVQGEFEFVSEVPESTWIDDEGILHVRGLPYVLTSTAGDLEITITGTTNYNQDLDTGGDGDFFGDDHTVEVTWGGLTGTFRGRHSGTTINQVGYGSHVYQGISGDFVGMKLKLYSVFYFDENRGEYEGVILNPHGE